MIPTPESIVEDVTAEVVRLRRQRTALVVALKEALQVILIAVGAHVDIAGFDPENHVTVKRLRAAIAEAEQL